MVSMEKKEKTGMNIYVDVRAEKEGNGSKERPYRYISDAAKIACAGDEVIVAPGIYREYIDPANSGTEEHSIIYRSEKALQAVITGAEKVSSWTQYQGNVWIARIQNSLFGSYNPYTQIIGGDWYFDSAVRHAGAVYLNDKQMYEAESLEECIKGEVYDSSWEPEFSIYKWYTEQDGDTTVIYANFQGKNPNRENVEINVRRNCFFPSKNGINYITLSGFTVTKAATTWAPPAAFQDGMIGPNWSKGWIIEDCDISNSKCCGISLGKYYDPENDHYFTRHHVKSPTQMERDAVCRGQEHGWTKEKIGGHIVRRCNIHHCEQAGIAGRMGCVFSLIEDNHIHHINNMQQLGGAEIAGVKLHAAIDVIFRRNHIHHCTMGIWCDWQAQGTRITQNLMHHNYPPAGAGKQVGSKTSQDIFIEVGHGPTLIDNNILLSKTSLKMATEGIACVHNLILGAFSAVGSGSDWMINGVNQPRYTPYHFAHRTEVMGFMTILHGDDRFYNNIFVQNWEPKGAGEIEDMGFASMDNEKVGTAVFDRYPDYEEWIAKFEMDRPADMIRLAQYHFEHLPVWINGNAYFNGAAAWKKEEVNLVNNGKHVEVCLEENDGSLCLKTNLYDYLKDFHVGIVTSETLGKAFEPEERFENPDGSSITFDRDYFGEHRRTETIPGPFCSGEELKKAVWKTEK